MIEYERENIPLAKQLRKNMTPWEKKLSYEFLRGFPVRFQRQKAIRNYIVDFYCAKARLIIELDGGGHYEADQREADEVSTKELEQLGLTVLRFSKFDIGRHFEAVCEVIAREVKKSGPL